MSSAWQKEVEDLKRTLLDQQRGFERPFFVAIDGRSGTGKSTFARALAQELDAQLIAGDDFFARGEAILEETPEALAQICIDWKAQRSILEPLRRSKPTSFFPYDWDAFDGSTSTKMTRLEPRQFVILEGVYAARPELRDLFDLTLLMELADAERLTRLADREGGLSAWEQQWHRAEDWYFEAIAPSHSFDVVLSDLPDVPST